MRIGNPLELAPTTATKSRPPVATVTALRAGGRSDQKRLEPRRRRLAVDTSIVVAGLLVDHSQHELARFVSLAPEMEVLLADLKVAYDLT
jgi:hypothetical protein